MSETVIAHWESKRSLSHKRLSDALLCARNCESEPKLITRLETWCSRLDIILEGFNDAHINLVCELQKAGVDDKELQGQSVFQEQADDMYFEVLEAKRKYLKESKVEFASPSQPCHQPKPKTKLPPIKLPTFTGEFKDFPGYIDLFNTLVHQRTDLTNIEKFQYLITTLSGEPINIIRAFHVSEANYMSAYEALVNRYNNKRYLAFMCWEQINNLKAMPSGSAQSLRNLLDVYGENIAMLSSLGLPTSEWNFVLFHSLLTKLDKASREAFELSSTGKDFPSFNELKSFLLDRCSALERSLFSNENNKSVVQQQNNYHNKRVNSTNQPKSTPTMLLVQSNNQSCVLCKESHALYSCPNFLSKTPQERSQVIKQFKLCFNCLRSNHITTNCNSTHSCKTCNQRHNSLLHFPKRTETGGPVNPQHKQASAAYHQTSSSSYSNVKEGVITPVTSLSNMSSGSSSGSHFVMLATAEVEVKDGQGTFQKVRILLDPGSQSHIITKTCARRLGLSQYKTQTPMSGIGEVPACSTSKVFLEIRPVGKVEPTFTTEAVTLDKICGNMPTHPVNVQNFEHLANLKLADENYHSSRPVDILIGGEIFPQILIPGKIDGGHHAATAINTIFGFILMGKTLTNSSFPTPLSINHVSVDTNLDIAVQKFWELDNIPTGDNKQSHSVEDIQCEDIFQSTHKRDVAGRYIVNLPFRDQSPPSFEKSYPIALRRFVQLEKRLLAKPAFHEKYKQHVMDYLSSGQMERVPANECQSSTAYYLAHHAVLKSDRDLRVVYDASAKDNKGHSLNDTLLTGPKLQADITNILLRFRLHAIVFTADVRQMYRQISVAEEHCDFQRILFRCSPEKSFRKLNPFLDQNHILRVGGRLSQSDLSYESKHPALLPRKHRLTQLIIQCTHNENFHPGLQTMQFLLLQNFWILSPRRAIRQVLSNCYRCFRVKPHNFEPEMADLPRSRVTQIKAFQSVGCDYAGPFNITFQRYRGTRSVKAYLCLFVCFATKAVHLELASDLSTEAFLAALRRFVARRGRCNVIHSDCGSNFKGAQSQLIDLMRAACETERIEFKFNPPGAPHFGGLWEAGVKSVKTHLYRVVGTQILTYEELNTLLTQVESILNTRPLCPLSSDPSDVSVLTPGHFLTLAPLTTVPSLDYSNISMNRLTRWQLLQKMHQDFWSRWHSEYLTTLSQRLKWTKASPPVNIDQLVIIKNETTHPLRWHFGRIIKLHPGRDGIPRSASVRTAQGVFDRPLVKLCPLPNND